MSLNEMALGFVSGAAGAMLFDYGRGFVQAWREDHQSRVIFTFRASTAVAGIDYAGGDNPWFGFLVTERVVSPETGEILRAAVERYRARNPWLPHDGDRFELKDGELVKL